MKSSSVELSTPCLAICFLFGANCGDHDTPTELEEGPGVVRSPYVVGTHFIPSDDLILTEFDAFGGPDFVDYPMCIYPESDGQTINDPDAVLGHMETIINTWLPYLYNRWGFGVYSVDLELKSTTEENCASEYDGFRPFSVSSYDGDAFGGMAKAIRVRFPWNTVNRFSDGTSDRQSILHEVGHVFGLMHTMEQSPNSVMDYDDMHNFSGIGGDDIVGMTHAWKYLSGQVNRGDCEFGYTGGPTCVPSDADLDPRQIRNGLTGQCVQVSGTGGDSTLVASPCDGKGHQKFSMMRVANGWRLQLSAPELCVKAADASDGGLFTTTDCSDNSRDQEFTLLLNSDDTYMIRNEHSGMVVQIHGGIVEQSPPVGGIHQTWRLEAPGSTCDQVDCCPGDEDKTDPGICGCGTSDADDDGDETPNCHDACPRDENKTQPGICGCGEPEPGPGETTCREPTTDGDGPDGGDAGDVEPSPTNPALHGKPSYGCTATPVSGSCWPALWLLGLLLLGRGAGPRKRRADSQPKSHFSVRQLPCCTNWPIPANSEAAAGIGQLSNYYRWYLEVPFKV